MKIQWTREMILTKTSLYKDEQSKITIQFGETNKNITDNLKYPNNRITSTKYNIFSWGPKSLLIQFKRGANLYFLFVSILTCLYFSPKSPASMVGTFVFILLAAMIKEGVEDYNRFLQDKIANKRLVLKWEVDKWVQIQCYSLMPGDIVKLQKEEEFSADILLLLSSNEDGHCYVDTRNLDGETNLKDKDCLEEFKELDEEEIKILKGKLDCEPPNENLTSWEGVIDYNNNLICASLKNLILKGCILKNTNYCIGVVVYCGKLTKIMKNSKNPSHKTSKIILIMNNLLYSIFIFEILICFTFAILNLVWGNRERQYTSYIYNKNDQQTTNKFKLFILSFFSFFVAYSHLIPISLYVALEIIKIFQGMLVYYDDEIYDSYIKKPAQCRSTDLIEELGQVEIIFSDKTGTLTQNSMILKKCFIYNKVYGNDPTENEDKMCTLSGDTLIGKKMQSRDEFDTLDKKKIEEFLLALSLCHSVFPEKTLQGVVYQGSSPDEIALLNGARQIGVEYVSKDFSEMIIYNHFDNTEKRYELKVEIPFDSDRRRMSVIVIDKETNQYLVLTKGADTVMMKISNIEQQFLNDFNRANKNFSKEGLRVLYLAKKVMGHREFEDWEKRYQSAKINNNNLYELYSEIENNLNLLGSTAVEDKLQEGVPDTIFTLISCGIRIWVLTGDKKDTAEGIAKSCSLINENMFIEYYTIENFSEITNLIEERIKEFEIDLNFNQELKKITRNIRKKRNKDMSIFVDGAALEEILSKEDLCKKFFYLCIVSKSVICCRVSPKQKARVVGMAKQYGNWVTLSIGDGANDVPMIMEAHIGVGIQGKEGTQAVRSSDFSIGQFRFLQKLLLIYGRNGYSKISKFILYYFYKNIIVVFTELCFALWNGFSGQIYFVDWFSTLYNAFWTSWPCLFTFSLEKDVTLLIAKKFPQLYECGQKNYYFNMKNFWTYICYSIYHGIFCFLIPNFGLKLIIDNTGKSFSHWHTSVISFSLIIHIVNFKLMMISNYWNLLSIITNIISILFYYLCLLFMSSEIFSFNFQNEMANVIPFLFSNYKFLITMFFGPFLVLIPDLTFKQLSYIGFPSPIEEIRKRLNDPAFIKFVTPVETKHDLESSFVKKIDHELKTVFKDMKKKKVKDVNHSRASLLMNSIVANDTVTTVQNTKSACNNNLLDKSKIIQQNEIIKKEKIIENLFQVDEYKVKEFKDKVNQRDSKIKECKFKNHNEDIKISETKETLPIVEIRRISVSKNAYFEKVPSKRPTIPQEAKHQEEDEKNNKEDLVHNNVQINMVKISEENLLNVVLNPTINEIETFKVNPEIKTGQNENNYININDTLVLDTTLNKFDTQKDNDILGSFKFNSSANISKSSINVVNQHSNPNDPLQLTNEFNEFLNPSSFKPNNLENKLSKEQIFKTGTFAPNNLQTNNSQTKLHYNLEKISSRRSQEDVQSAKKDDKSDDHNIYILENPSSADESDFTDDIRYKAINQVKIIEKPRKSKEQRKSRKASKFAK